MVLKPRVSLHGSGGSIELSNWGGGRFVLMQGSNGLGMASQELSTAALPQGGSVLLHRRRTDGETMIPLLLGGSYGERFEDRRLLERMCQGEVEVRVTQPDGGSRSRRGFYVDGLEGSYDAGEDSQDGQKLVLTFRCPDPLWYGGQLVERWALSPERRQWLSQLRDEPSTPRLVRTNYVLSPGAGHTLVGSTRLAVVAEVDSSFGRDGASLKVESVPGTYVPVPSVMFDASAVNSMRFAGGVWVHGAGRVTVEIMHRDRGGSLVVSASSSQVVDGWAWVTVEEQTAFVGDRSLRVSLRTSSGGVPPVGTAFHVDDRVMVAAGQDLSPFDGDTVEVGMQYAWAGTPGASTSHEYEISMDDTMAVPFQLMALSESTVQGAKEVDISGDADAEAILHITGPGEDLEVVNETTGQRIFITGEIYETVVIDGRPGWQDIYSESRQGGEWWEFVNDDAPDELITLRPGVNRIRVTMVNAHPQSSVELRYRQTYLAGH